MMTICRNLALKHEAHTGLHDRSGNVDPVCTQNSPVLSTPSCGQDLREHTRSTFCSTPEGTQGRRERLPQLTSSSFDLLSGVKAPLFWQGLGGGGLCVVG